jgi:type IV pilus assembly protein PilV
MYLINTMHRPIAQRGVGMVEVLVAMLILAVGVLGYSILQVRSIAATNESMMRSQAVFILRGLSDAIRMNTVGQQNGNYQNATGVFNRTSAPTAPTSCSYRTSFSGFCTPAQFARWDAYQYSLIAFQSGIKINMLTCPGTVASGTMPARQCLVAAWGKTDPTFEENAGTVAETACMKDGVYKAAATCLVLEAY